MKKITPEIKKRLIKIQALAKAGIDGEKENAARLLNHLMKQYSLTTEDISHEEPTKLYKFSFGTTEDKTLLFQVVRKILNVNTVNYYKVRGSTRTLKLKLTEWEFLQIDEMFELYKTEFRKYAKEQQSKLCQAFIMKNNIFASDPIDKDNVKESKMSASEWNELFAMARNMNAVKLPNEVIGYKK